MSVNKTSLLSLIIALVALVLGVFHPARDVSDKPMKETAYERVIRTQTLRCGYIPFVPNLIKDPNTAALSGLDYDIAEAIGRKLGIKIEWTEETGWATMVPALNASRFDALCEAAWVSPAVAKEAYYSRPYYYQPLFLTVRTNDERFDLDISAIDNKDISIASLDGDNQRFIAEEDFPNATIYTLPDMAGESTLLESLAAKKADLTFEDAYDVGDYNMHNGGKLKLAQVDKPIRIYPVGYVLPMGDDKLRAMINAAFDEMIYSGQIDKLLKKYEKYPNSFFPVERPHTLSSSASSTVQENTK